MNRQQLLFKLKRLLQRQAVNTRQNLTLILIGFAMSLLGIGLVMGGEFLVRDPFHRELIALAGVVIIAIACVLAATGYVSMSLLKIFYIITRDDKDEDEDEDEDEQQRKKKI